MIESARPISSKENAVHRAPPLVRALDAGSGLRTIQTGGAEWRWLIKVVAITLLLVEVPYLLAGSQEAQGWAFTGMLWAPQDTAQYLAAMREGAAGPSWLIHDRLTGEPHGPVFMYPLYVGLGKLAAAFGLGPELVFHASEIIARGILLAAIYLFCSAVFRGVGQRRLAFLVVTFSSGLSFWLLLLDAVRPFMGEYRSLFVVDLYLPDVSTFLVLFIAPHHMLGLALLLLAARFYLASWSRPDRLAPALVGIMVAALGLINPFSLISLCAAFPGHLVVMWLQDRRLPRAALLSLGATLLVAAPFLAYNLLVFGLDPFWGVVYGQQNFTPGPPLPILALGLAPTLGLAILGLPALLARPAPACRLVLVYIIVGLALMYFPLGLGFQRRFAYGLHPMLALVAAAALDRLWQPGRRSDDLAPSAGRSSLTFALLLALFASAACGYGFKLQAATHPTWPVGQSGAFQPASLREAGRWLAGVMAPDDVVLADVLTGNYLAALVPGRVFVGHQIATLRFEEKVDAARAFYRQGDDQLAGARFLAENSIGYVVSGPRERALRTAPLTGTYLAPVYTTDEVVIYQVQLVGPDSRDATELTRSRTGAGQ